MWGMYLPLINMTGTYCAHFIFKIRSPPSNHWRVTLSELSRGMAPTQIICPLIMRWGWGHVVSVYSTTQKFLFVLILPDSGLVYPASGSDLQDMELPDFRLFSWVWPLSSIPRLLSCNISSASLKNKPANNAMCVQFLDVGEGKERPAPHLGWNVIIPSQTQKKLVESWYLWAERKLWMNEETKAHSSGQRAELGLSWLLIDTLSTVLSCLSSSFLVN